MDEVTEKLFEAGNNRVHILRRADGTFTYRHQFRDNGVWGELGPVGGFYDSVETAESEIRARVWWLRKPIEGLL